LTPLSIDLAIFSIGDGELLAGGLEVAAPRALDVADLVIAAARVLIGSAASTRPWWRSFWKGSLVVT
jgi:hypothetical protein